MLRSFKPWSSLAKAYRGAAKCILMGFEIDGWTLQMLRSFRPTLAYLCLPWHRKVFSHFFFRKCRMDPSIAPEQLQALEQPCQGLRKVFSYERRN